MKKSEQNKILDDYFQRELKSIGFKKNGIHYYLHDSPVIIQIQNGWKYSDEILIACTLDFLSNTKDEKGKLKVSKFLSDFPLAIPLRILKQQYETHGTIWEFKYDLNFITRRMGTTRNMIPVDLKLFFYEFKKVKYLTEEYISDSIRILLNEGMKLKNEFDTEAAYFSMSKYEKERNPNSSISSIKAYNQIKNELEKQLQKEGKSVPIRKRNIIEQLQLKNHYRKMKNWKKNKNY